MNQRERHIRILKEFTFDEFKQKVYKAKKISRPISGTEEDGVVIFQHQEDKFSNHGCIIYPEFMEFCYSLEGCPKKLLFYLIFHHVDESTNKFLFNAHVIHDFSSYNDIKTNGGKPYTKGVIKAALRTLVKMNILLNTKRREYMVNPTVIGGKNLSGRINLITQYSHLLIEKGKDSDTKFYPV